MKYFSEITKELYDTQEELNEAEAIYLEDVSDDCDDEMSAVEDKCTGCGECGGCKDCSEEDEIIENVPTRKELAANVAAAEQRLKEAHAEYELSKKQVEELSKAYLESIEAIMEPAKAAVKEAEKAKYNAIKAFNDSYGAYQVTYTGARAAEELMRTLDQLDTNKLFDVFFNRRWF